MTLAPAENAAAKSVLVVDDEPNIMLSLQYLMKQAGYQVRLARDGEEALAAVEASPPDLVLLDINIPKRNGYEVCQAIRADDRFKGVRILMLTAKGREVEIEKGLALGADGYETKPFSTRALAARVKEMLGKERAAG
ncbi:MAG: response regulator [Hyphomicrobiaceae bacterium]|nr:response regulator [Hyphomicrobiaceae bacterium]